MFIPPRSNINYTPQNTCFQNGLANSVVFNYNKKFDDIVDATIYFDGYAKFGSGDGSSNELIRHTDISHVFSDGCQKNKMFNLGIFSHSYIFNEGHENYEHCLYDYVTRHEC